MTQPWQPTGWTNEPGPTPPFAAPPFGTPGYGEPQPLNAPPAFPPTSPPTFPPTAPPHSWDAGAPMPTSPTPGLSSPPARRGVGGRVALVVLSATSLVGVGWIGRDLTTGSNTVSSIVGAPTSSTGASVQTTQNSNGVTPQIAVTGDEPAQAVAAALGPAVVKILTEDGLGSGVVYDAEGFVLTNAHVIGEAATVSVQFSDGDQVEASVVGRDPGSDIAVLKLDSTGRSAVARLAQDPPAVGSTAIAIGSPFGFDQTVTAGIVSAVDRPVEDQSGGTRAAITINMIQTDAPINPGNSGGALANRNGEVIGINTAIFSQSGENNGIGFAIPIQTAKGVADKIVKGESLDKGYLGATLKSPTTGDAGAQIVTVAQGSPASKAGLKRNDVITAIDGQAIKSRGDLSARITARSPGDVVKLDVIRNSEQINVEVTLGKK